MVLTKLEETIINDAKQYLDEIKEKPYKNDMGNSYADAWLQLKSLTKLGYYADSGLTDAAREQLMTIDKESVQYFRA